MRCIHPKRVTSWLKQKVIINAMKSVLITPRDKKEFDKAFLELIELGKERKRLTQKDDDEISFAFLMNFRQDTAPIQARIVSKKST